MAGGSDNRELRVVVVDDEPSIRALLRAYLATAHMRVVGEAEDGRAGLQATRQHRPDVVVVDWQMPEMDGIELGTRLRAEFPDLGMVMFSSRVGQHLAEVAAAVGIDEYVEKPADLDQLAGAIRRAVEKRQFA